MISPAEIRAAVTMREAITSVRDAFRLNALGRTTLPDPMGFEIEQSHAEIHVKAAHLSGSAIFVVKIATDFYAHPGNPLPANGIMIAVDARNGAPLAILADGGFLTDLRTGAAGAVAADTLARADAQSVGLVGAGVQAAVQLEALVQVRQIERVCVYSRDRRRAQEFVAGVADFYNGEIAVVEDIESATLDLDIVVTTTPARSPIVEAKWVTPGTHVTAVGSDRPTKHELESAILSRAVVVVDRLSQALTLGEVHHAVAEGAISVDDVRGELGDVLVGLVQGRQNELEVTVADLTGVGIQDAAVATVVLENVGLLAAPSSGDPNGADNGV